MSTQIKTRLLLLSDTHARAPNHSDKTSQPCRWPLPTADVAIHTGDLTLTGKLHEHEKAIDLLQRLQADLKIVIPGNHDLTLDDKYYAEKSHLHGPRPKYTAEQLQHIRSLYTGHEAKAANIVYLEEGTRTFKLKNGATLTIYASAYTPEFCDWAFAYDRDTDRFNSTDAQNPVTTYNAETSTNVDVMLTHGPPVGILDKVQRWGGGESHVGCEHLFNAVARARPLLHCFGHIHEGWGAVRKTWDGEPGVKAYLSLEEVSSNCEAVHVDIEKMVEDMGAYADATDLHRGVQTLFVNSSIMNLRYKPNQGAWIIDVMLNQTPK